MTAQIDILLATYNGARYLPEQLQSLLDQTHRDWRMIVRDDGSSDGSLGIVRDWAAEHAVDLTVLDDGLGNLGACASFGKLMEASSAPYFAFCDQDDVWLPEKLAVMLKAIREAESRLGPGKPLLAYSDLAVVDEYLRVKAQSFRQYCSIGSVPEQVPLRKLLIHNVVTGCATIGNRSIRDHATPIPDGARMHDWWVALVACEFGELVDVSEPTILYRQHGNNTLGALRLDLSGIFLRFVHNPLKILRLRSQLVFAEKQQAKEFGYKFSGSMNEYSEILTNGYGNLDSLNLIARKLFVFRHNLKRHNILSQLTFLLVV